MSSLFGLKGLLWVAAAIIDLVFARLAWQQLGTSRRDRIPRRLHRQQQDRHPSPSQRHLAPPGVRGLRQPPGGGTARGRPQLKSAPGSGLGMEYPGALAASRAPSVNGKEL